MDESPLQQILKHVRNFFFSAVNKEFLIFLFFLLLSGTFWLLMSLNEDYEREVEVPVRLVGIPKNVVVTSDVQDTLHVTVRDKGYALVAYLYGEGLQPVDIDFKTYAKEGRGTVPSSDIRKQIDRRLAGSTKVVGVKPDKLEFFFNLGLNRRFPVRLLGTITPGESYYIAKTKFVPDSVTVYANEETLDSIKHIYTETLHLTDITDTIVREVRLRKMQGVKCVPEVISVAFYPDILTEESIEVPITPINMPEGKLLRTFPSRVKLSFVTGASLFRTIRAENFSVVVDYKELMANPSDKCQLHIRAVPNGVTKARTEVEQVDYLIEQQ